MVEQEHSNGSTPFPETIIFGDRSSPNTNGSKIGSLYNSFQETVHQDAYFSNLTPYDIFHNDNTESFVEDYWQRMHDDKVSFVPDSYFEINSPVSFWESSPLDLMETLKMDDVFQVDTDDLVQSPTLAELNANNDESLFDSFDNFCTSHSTEDKSVNKSLISAPCSNMHSVYKMPSLIEKSEIKTDPEFSSEKTNAPPHLDVSFEQNCISENESKFALDSQENKLKLLSPNSVILYKHDTKSQVIAKLIKQEYPDDESNIETFEDEKIENSSQIPSLDREICDSEEDDSDMDCDYSSDEKSEEDTKIQTHKEASANRLLFKKKSRYFWQYNIQSKGPKAPKMRLNGKSTVTDEFPGVSDPVFASSYLNKGIQHAGKARRGDGNDLTPNPKKLYNIGLELEKLTSLIEGLIPANELPINARSKSRKEKNKLASRACRLKKKAQHEANKLKFFGLQQEQKQLVNVINEVKKMIRKGVDNVQHRKVQFIHAKVESLCLRKYNAKVAGRTAEFVNRVLKNVETGYKDCLSIENYEK